MHDLVTLGETMIRLSPPVPQRIEQAVAFEINVGGAESNVAVAVSRLGLSAAWMSRLPENPLGERIKSHLRLASGVVDSVVSMANLTWPLLTNLNSWRFSGVGLVSSTRI